LSASLKPRQANRLLLASVVLLVAAGLTEFLPYYSVEYGQSRYQYTGAQLLAGSYDDEPSWVPPNASDGRVDAVLVLLASVLGLATLWPPRRRVLAWLLGVATVIVAIGGCASTFEIDVLLGGVEEHVEFGFFLGLAALAAGSVVRVVLWRLPLETAPASA
jgi:hypothetical protein